MTGRLPRAVRLAGLALLLAVLVLGGCGRAGDSPDSAAPSGVRPQPCPTGTECGSETVPGLAARKQAVLAAGGDSLDVAVAMLESVDMSADYPFGDRKTGDSANFGIFKQNWFMLRQACARFEDRTVAQWRDGAVLNTDLAADVDCLNQSQDHYGMELWFGGQRNGETGVDEPDTADIAAYRTAVLWIRDQIAADPEGLTNDVRYWVAVPAI